MKLHMCCHFHSVSSLNYSYEINHTVLYSCLVQTLWLYRSPHAHLFHLYYTSFIFLPLGESACSPQTTACLVVSIGNNSFSSWSSYTEACHSEPSLSLSKFYFQGFFIYPLLSQLSMDFVSSLPPYLHPHIYCTQILSKCSRQLSSFYTIYNVCHKSSLSFSVLHVSPHLLTSLIWKSSNCHLLCPLWVQS